MNFSIHILTLVGYCKDIPFSSFYYSFKGLREGKLVSHIYLFY